MLVRTLSSVILFFVTSLAAMAEEAITYKFDGTFEDAQFAVENSIVDHGLVIDYVSHVGEMLNRTGEDVGSSEKIFDEADIFIFCSAAVSRQVMETNPMNIVHCPYGIFVTQRNSEVIIGHRDYSGGSMQPVRELLVSIAESAISN